MRELRAGEVLCGSRVEAVTHLAIMCRLSACSKMYAPKIIKRNLPQVSNVRIYGINSIYALLLL